MRVKNEINPLLKGWNLAELETNNILILPQEHNTLIFLKYNNNWGESRSYLEEKVILEQHVHINNKNIIILLDPEKENQSWATRIQDGKQTVELLERIHLPKSLANILPVNIEFKDSELKPYVTGNGLTEVIPIGYFKSNIKTYYKGLSY